MDELDIEDIAGQVKRKKSINSGRKGKGGERTLCKLLSKRFGDNFSRTIGSGNRGKQVILSHYATKIFSGDLVCPENFKWVFECKCGYVDIDLNAAFAGGIKQLDEFLAQAEDGGAETTRKPMLCWKKDRKPWLAFVKTIELNHKSNFTYMMIYRDWTVVALEELLKFEDSFWKDI